MATVQEVLIFMGAAEGSWYSAGSVSRDVRYRSSFANVNSGLSFGTFQFDCATNAKARYVLRKVLDDAVAAGGRSEGGHVSWANSTLPGSRLDDHAAGRIYGGATRRNAQAYVSPSDRVLVDTILAQPASRALIDQADIGKSGTDQTSMAKLIADAARNWPPPWKLDIFDPGTINYLYLLAYLMATNNRHANEDAFRSWLGGRATPTFSGPAGGYQLKTPPTIADMHRFLHSMKMWSGDQGSYANLRARLDPALEQITDAHALKVSGTTVSWAQSDRPALH